MPSIPKISDSQRLAEIYKELKAPSDSGDRPGIRFAKALILLEQGIERLSALSIDIADTRAAMREIDQQLFTVYMSLKE